MKYGFLQKVFWTVFKGTFKKELTGVLKENDPKAVMKAAHKEYKVILSGVDEFDKDDRFLFNILSAAMFSAILKHLKRKPTLEEARLYYRTAMNNNYFVRKMSKGTEEFTEKGRAKLKADAEKSMKCNNPYSWKFTVEDGETINQYTTKFYTCGICHLLTQQGLKEYIPAMCTYDYDMAAMNNTTFTREYTLAGGGEYCDCHYDHKSKGHKNGEVA